MSKLQLALMFTIPAMQMAASILRNKDANSTGVDDEVAEALEYTITRLEKYVAEGQPVG